MATFSASLESASSVQKELADEEDRHDDLQREFGKAQKELAEVKRAGAAVLAAVEATMVPLMEQIAAARKECQDQEVLASIRALDQGERPDGQDPVAVLEAEINHLQLDISHYQSQVERLQSEDRRRSTELGRLRGDLSDVSEQLAYEQQSVRHYQFCQQLEAGGPSDQGRVLELRAESRLRELAEQRTGRLARHVTRLAGDTAAQQSTIEQMGKRLAKLQKSRQEKDWQLSAAASAASGLQNKLTGVPDGAEEAMESAALPAVEARKGKAGRGLKGSSRNSNNSASTGKLPHLSF